MLSLQIAYISFMLLSVADVRAVANAVLPRFFLEDMRESAFKVFSSCRGKKYVVTSSPTITVQPFLQEYLIVDCVVGTELRSFGGYYLGLVAAPGLMIGKSQHETLVEILGDAKKIDVGLWNAVDDHSMLPCQEGYIVDMEDEVILLQRKSYPKPLIFHDGRLVARPIPLNCAAVFLWLPFGVILAIFRLLIGKLLPNKLGLMAAAATGLSVQA